MPRRCSWSSIAAWPLRWEGPELDAQAGQAAVEVLEIAVERLEKK